jgi:hypothetical protein
LSSEVDRARARAHYRKHRDRKLAYAKAWKAANPEKVRAHRKNEKRVDRTEYQRAWRARDGNGLRLRLRKYGITLADYNNLWQAQHGLCAVGGEPLMRVNVEHSHATGRVRGLVCTKHNLLLGLIEQDVDVAKRAMAYLEKYE